MPKVSQKVKSSKKVEQSYAINPMAIEEAGRSGYKILESRLCPDCSQKFDKSKDNGELTFQDLRECIQKSCSQDLNFVTPAMPLLECAFRFLIASPKEPLTLTELHSKVNDLWSNAPWPRHISPESLARAISSDSYYGIVEVATTKAKR